MSMDNHNEENNRKPKWLPQNCELPYFVYGLLKSGMPAYERIRCYVELCENEKANGLLYVRDGLPMLKPNNRDTDIVSGDLLSFEAGRAVEAYEKISSFEPKKHYIWKEIELCSGTLANTLAIRSENKGGAQLLDGDSWNLRDDPAFGPGLDEVAAILKEVDDMNGETFESNWKRFFRSQMAYLLLWSILERISALCIGPSEQPTARIKRLGELPGMDGIVKKWVKRKGTVTDARDPRTMHSLDADDPNKSFAYYYQVRSNLSHRGKAVFKEFDVVHYSLRELLGITQDFLAGLENAQENQTS